MFLIAPYDNRKTISNSVSPNSDLFVKRGQIRPTLVTEKYR